MKTTEELLTTILSYLADKFKNRLVLKGGMLLRLMGSPRSTVDLDYCWIPTKSRKMLAQELRTSLEQIDGIRIADIQINARGVFLKISEMNANLNVNVEISLVKSFHLPPKPVSTTVLANLYSLATQIITAMDLAEAFSHKIAATLERDLLRDIYDLAQLEPLIPFDKGTLMDRLSRLEIGRAKPIKASCHEAAAMLRKKMDRITADRVLRELIRVVPENQLIGLEIILRASISRIIQRMEIM